MTVNVRSAEMPSIRLYEAETSVDVIAARHGLEHAEVVDFSLNVNPLGSPPAALEAARAAVASSNLYPDFRFGSLRAALARRHSVSEDCLFFGAGLDDVIKLLLHAWTSEGDTVLIHLPTFPRYELEARLRGCSVIGVESERPETIDTEALRRSLTEQAIALAFLCTPNNPTGATIDSSEIARMARAFPDTIFVVDEALVYPLDDGAVPLCGAHRNICVMRTFSKYFGLAGLRAGYSIAPAELVRVADVGRPPFNMAIAAVHAAAAALDDEWFLRSCKQVFTEEVEHFRGALSCMRGISVRGSNANMLLLDLGSRDAAATVSRLAAKGVVVADATSFRGLERHNMIRVSLRRREDNLKLIAALESVP